MVPGGDLAIALGKLNFDRILGVAVTMRNWNTVAKLAALAGVRECAVRPHRGILAAGRVPRRRAFLPEGGHALSGLGGREDGL